MTDAHRHWLPGDSSGHAAHAALSKEKSTTTRHESLSSLSTSCLVHLLRDTSDQLVQSRKKFMMAKHSPEIIDRNRTANSARREIGENSRARNRTRQFLLSALLGKFAEL